LGSQALGKRGDRRMPRIQQLPQSGAFYKIARLTRQQYTAAFSMLATRRHVR